MSNIKHRIMNNEVTRIHLDIRNSMFVIRYSKKLFYSFFLLFLLPLFSFSQKDSTANLKSGIAKFNEGNYDVAVMEFNKAIEQCPKCAEVYYYLGEISFLQKDNKKAMENFNKTIELDSTYSKAYKDRGALKAMLEDYRGAIDDFNIAIKQDKSFSDAYFNRATSYESLKEYKSSIEDYTKVISMNKKDFQAYEQRGRAKFEMGDAKGACKDWSKAGELGDFKAYDYIKKNCK